MQYPTEIIPRSWTTMSFTRLTPPECSVPTEQGCRVWDVASCWDCRDIQMLANLEQPRIQVMSLLSTVRLRFFNLYADTHSVKLHVRSLSSRQELRS